MEVRHQLVEMRGSPLTDLRCAEDGIARFLDSTSPGATRKIQCLDDEVDVGRFAAGVTDRFSTSLTAAHTVFLRAFSCLHQGGSFDCGQDIPDRRSSAGHTGDRTDIRARNRRDDPRGTCGARRGAVVVAAFRAAVHEGDVPVGFQAFN